MGQLSEREAKAWQSCVTQLLNDRGLKRASKVLNRRRSIWARGLRGALAGAALAAVILLVLFSLMTSRRSRHLIQMFRQLHGEA